MTIRRLHFPDGWVSPTLLAVFHALKEARLVGGCVRDLYLGDYPTDVDIATPLTPDIVTQKLTKAGFNVRPTGIAHGTVTAFKDQRFFEITTLRSDIDTDGRHAKVQFSTSYREDAARRDFTFNALYADIDGTLWDYFNGVDDLEAGIVRFIGDPRERLKEDALRALRFMRFHARFGHANTDEDTLSALKETISSLGQLSRERKTQEMFALLATPHPEKGIKLMVQLGYDKAMQMTHTNIPALVRYIALLDLPHEYPLRLLNALLWRNETSLTENPHFIFSKHQLSFITKTAFQTMPEPPMHSMAKWCALEGTDSVIERMRLHYAYALDAGLRQRVYEAIQRWDGFHAADFPLTGEDAIAFGLKQEAIGKALHSVKNWWAENNFPEREACLHKLEETAKNADA